jgi:hypothetical protein
MNGFKSRRKEKNLKVATAEEEVDFEVVLVFSKL